MFINQCMARFQYLAQSRAVCTIDTLNRTFRLGIISIEIVPRALVFLIISETQPWWRRADWGPGRQDKPATAISSAFA
jgi:hypothetical protein